MILLLLLLIPTVSSIQCSSSQSSLFYLPYPSNISNPYTTKCFQKCSETDCSGVIITDFICITLSNTSFSYNLDYSVFTPNKCIDGLSRPTVSSSASQLVIPDWEASIISTSTFDQCIMKCANDDTCNSCEYFNDSSDCLLSNISSREGIEPIPEVDGFNVTYAQVNSHLPKGECNDRFNSFFIQSYTIDIYGEAKLFNGSNGIQDCISRCIDCIGVLYSSYYNECFTIHSSTSSIPLSFIDHTFTVLISLCTPPSIPCHPLSSIYISPSTSMITERLHCIHKCMNDPSCRYGYSLSQSQCLISPNPLQLTPTITRYCSTLDTSEFDGAAVLYEESNFCAKGNSIDVKGISIVECMQLCLTHPTKNCDAVSYDETKELCSVFEEGTIEKKDGHCTFLSLNMITFDKEGIEYADKIGDEITKQLIDYKSSINKKARKGISKRKKAKARGLKIKGKGSVDRIEEEIELKTICNMDSIHVVIHSSSYINGEVFVKDHSSSCSIPLSNKNDTILIIKMNETVKCGIIEKDSRYSFVIVVKRDKTNGVLTENDRLFQLTCDYSNAHSTTVSSILRMGDNNYKKLPITGKVDVGNELRMELKSNKDGKIGKVQIGQPIQLVFSSQSDSSVTINSCTATNDLKNESIDIIESGCPAIGTSFDIVRGPIKRTANGFILPLRAFKFNKGQGVQIACEVEQCQGICPEINCSSSSFRSKRDQYPSKINNNTKIVTIDMEIIENSSNCISKWKLFILLSLLLSSIILSLISIYIFVRRRFCINRY